MKQLLMALALGVSMASDFPQYWPNVRTLWQCCPSFVATDANRRRSPRRERLFDGRCVVL